MFDILGKYLAERIYITDKELMLIQSLSVQKKVAKQSFILREGEISDRMIFIVGGLLRLYKTDDRGNQHILRFASENQWIMDLESYLTGKPSHYNIETIELSTVLMWHKSQFHYLMEKIPSLRELMKALNVKKQIASQNRIFTFISQSVEEKYNHFIQRYPEVFNRVPLHMVASYLGVSRETLSRIRKRMTEK